MTNLEALCILFGQQGGTIHQFAKLTGCSVAQLLATETDNVEGWIAARAQRKSFLLLAKQNQGSVEWWAGAINCTKRNQP